MRALVCVCGLMILLLAASTGAGSAEHGDPGEPASWVARLIASTGEPVTSYRALRTLEAEARGGSMRARMVAWTALDPREGFTFEVIEEDGSEVIRSRVLRAALEAEHALRADGDVDRGAIGPANYTFTRAPAGVDDGWVRLAIAPRRADTLLVRGQILLSPYDGDLVQVHGTLVKRPSFWTRRVDVVRQYERIDGVRLPVLMQSTAQVLFVGTSRFSMRYEYVDINERPVHHGRRARAGDTIR